MGMHTVPALVVAFLLVSACGGGSTEQAPSHQPSAAVATTAAPSGPAGGTGQLTFVDVCANAIYLLGPAGSSDKVPMSATLNGPLNGPPSWSADGRRVAFTEPDALYVMDADGTDQQRLATSAGNAGLTSPQWSPDGSRIAFTSFSPDTQPTFSVHTISVDGTGERQVAEGTLAGWSPDSGSVIFVSGKLLAVAADGSGAPRQLSDLAVETFSGHFSLSPDQTRIAYVAPFSGAVATPQGPGGGTSAAPAVRDRYAIFVADIGGGGQPRQIVSSDTLAPDVLAFSPDGSRLAYVARGAEDMPLADGSYSGFDDLWLINADGSGQRQLTTGLQANVRSALWSPDGSRIVFAAQLLFVVGVDGAGPNLVPDPPDVRCPEISWRARP